MANERGPYQSFGGQRAADMTKLFQEMMNNYRSVLRNNTSATPDPMSRMTSRMTEHVSDAVTLVSRVSQAKDLQDIVGAQAEFVQKKINMFNDRALALNGLFAVAGNFVGSFAQLSQWRKDTERMARDSPDYTAAPDRDGRVRTWTQHPKGETDKR